MLTVYDKILWMELIGLDNRQSDMGIKAYVDNLGFVPDAVSIFMWSPDFVHFHDGLDADAEFPVDIGSYLDPWFDTPKKAGAPWRKSQLRQVVDEFHRYGVKALFSIFPCSLGNRFHHEWITDHPETAIVTTKGMEGRFPVIDPYSRLGDGSFYEDFLLGQVERVITDYNFDGWHLADGYNHNWQQLAFANYSDDMVGQFLAHTGLALPAHAAGEARGQYIWHDLRREWIAFNRWRGAGYWRKVVARLHGMGKLVTCNTCWTRDPVEALYRYGMDYRLLVDLGVDKLVIESCGAGGEILDHCWKANFSVPFFNVLNSTILLTKACAPKGHFLFNNCAQDLTEGWSILRHAPAFLEREIYTYSNLYRYNGQGLPEKCLSGLQVCLADGIEAHEWTWMHEKWDLGFGTKPEALSGVALVWSDAIVEAELEYYLRSRKALTANVLYKLLSLGAPIHATVNIRDVEQIKTPLLVINPGLLPTAEQERLLTYNATPVFMLGHLPASLPKADLSFAEGETRFALYGKAPQMELDLSEPPVEDLPADLMSIKEPGSFFVEQYYRPVSEAFYHLAARVIHATIPIDVETLESPDSRYFQIKGIQLPNKTWRYFIGNESWRYSMSDLLINRQICAIEVVNDFRRRPMKLEPRGDNQSGARCFIRVPPKGMGVIDVSFEK